MEAYVIAFSCNDNVRFNYARVVYVCAVIVRGGSRTVLGLLWGLL